MHCYVLPHITTTWCYYPNDNGILFSVSVLKFFNILLILMYHSIVLIVLAKPSEGCFEKQFHGTHFVHTRPVYATVTLALRFQL